MHGLVVLQNSKKQNSANQTALSLISTAAFTCLTHVREDGTGDHVTRGSQMMFYLWRIGRPLSLKNLFLNRAGWRSAEEKKKNANIMYEFTHARKHTHTCAYTYNMIPLGNLWPKSFMNSSLLVSAFRFSPSSFLQSWFASICTF